MDRDVTMDTDITMDTGISSDVDYLDNSFSSDSTDPELDFSDLDESCNYDDSVLLKQVEDANSRLERVARQLFWIEEKLWGLQRRLGREGGCVGYAESLGMQVETLEGVRCVYSEYVQRKSAELDRLYTQGVREGILTENTETYGYSRGYD